MTRLAYLDESQHDKAYIVAVAAIEHRHVAAVRRELRALTPKRQVRRHMVRESDSERRQMLDTFRRLPGTEVTVWIERRAGSVERRRQRALAGILELVLANGVDRLVLDHVHAAQQGRDHATLHRLLTSTGATYAYEPAKSREAMLWVPDAAAWCAGRNDHWHHQLDGWATVHVQH